jgi:hypothetical protein
MTRSSVVLDNLPTALAVLVIVVAVPLTWYQTWLLWRLHRAAPDVASLHTTGILSTSVALLVTTFALIFVNNEFDADARPLDSWATMVIARSALLCLAVVPSLLWLRWYRNAASRTDRKEEDNEEANQVKNGR